MDQHRSRVTVVITFHLLSRFQSKSAVLNEQTDAGLCFLTGELELLHQLQREQQTKRFPPPSLQVSDEEVVPPVASPQCEVALPLFLGL